jgi:hypothetical protein
LIWLAPPDELELVPFAPLAAFELGAPVVLPVALGIGEADDVELVPTPVVVGLSSRGEMDVICLVS